MSELKSISKAELEQHGPSSAQPWVSIDGVVYDVTAFAALHPGGERILLSATGADASNAFHVAHNSASVLRKYHDKLAIGRLEGYKPSAELILHADPSWIQGTTKEPSWLRPTHREWQQRVRAFVASRLLSTLESWQEKSKPPPEVMSALGSEGFLAVLCGSPFPIEYLPTEVARKLPADLDEFHEMILVDEIARLGHFGAIAAITNGPSIALSAILKFGTPAQKVAYVPDVILGRKFIALAISEPNAGSDVAGLTCLATKTVTGYTLSGQKKWITNGTYADNFVLAVRVAGAGERHSGLAFVVVSKDAPEFSVRKVNVTGAGISGTAYLVFKDTPIPQSALLGSEGQGFLMIMQNFVHERLYIATITIRLSRICLEESVRFALRREAFGGKLADIQAIRLLVGQMAAKVEMMQAWLESLVDQVIRMGKKRADTDLASTICLLKAECGDLYEFCANSTTHIFGGHALVASSPGHRIEGAVAAVKAYTIPAGATLVMRDFGGKTIFKKSKL